MVTVEVKTGMPGVFSKVAVVVVVVVVVDDDDDDDDVSQLFFHLRIIQSSGVLYKTIVVNLLSKIEFMVCLVRVFARFFVNITFFFEGKKQKSPLGPSWHDGRLDPDFWDVYPS